MPQDVTPLDARHEDQPRSTPIPAVPPSPGSAPDPKLMEGAVVLIFLALLAVFGVVGTLLAH